MTHNHDPFSPSAAVKAVTGKAAGVTDDAPAPEAPQGEPTAQQAAPPTANENGVPQGTVGEVLEWVGDDKERARAALDAEHATGEPRKSLVRRLEEQIG